MNINEKNPDELLSLKILDEIASNSEVTQRALSERLGIALGLVNTYIKHLIKKGYVRVMQFPRSRYKYLLTPEGFAEKSRLVYKHLSYYNNLFKTVRSDTLALFKRLEKEGVRNIIFCGTDEVAEIAYLSLRETSIELLCMLDKVPKEECLGYPVYSVDKVKDLDFHALFISSVKHKRELFDEVRSHGVPQQKIYYLGDLD